jgi:hypothetical protein
MLLDAASAGSCGIFSSLVQTLVQTDSGVVITSLPVSLTTAGCRVRNAKVEGSTPFRSTSDSPLSLADSGLFFLMQANSVRGFSKSTIRPHLDCRTVLRTAAYQDALR